MILKEIIKNYFLIDNRSWKIKKIIKNQTISTNYSFKRIICTFPPYKIRSKGIKNFCSFIFKLKGASTKFKVLNFLNYGLIKSLLLFTSSLTGNFEKIKSKTSFSDSDYTLKYSIKKIFQSKEFLILKN